MEELNAVIIDDSKTILYLMKSYLQELDIEAQTFENPLEAIKFLRDENNKIDFVFVDYVMPEMNGLDVISEIKFFYDGVIIMVTSVGENELKLKALQAGAVEFINKPILKAEFLATVRNLARIRMQQMMLEDEKFLIQAEVQRQIENIKRQERETLEVLAHVAEYRDENTFLHVKRVAEYSKILATAYGLDEKESDIIYQAAPLHDLGKIGIRDEVLLKTDKLTDEEYEIMKSHTTIGYEILRHSSSPILQMGAKIALTHHERWDGKGYPHGLKEDNIPIYGRIVAVADVFDALTAKRPYKKPWSLAEALTFMLDNSGKIFDPKLIDIFLEVHEKIFEYYHISEQEIKEN
jgi:response regulator RpfG family c-di-GMP phosphodiesterase